jgi:glutamate-5-semialdehyde dehydrogenase
MTESIIEQIMKSARAAFEAAPPVGDPAYQRYCERLAHHLMAGRHEVLRANRDDIAAAERRGLPPTLVNRLRLTERHLERMVELTRQVRAELPAVAAYGEPLRAGDCVLRQVPKPLGVVLMIYEARPTVTVDAALLPVVVGNAVLLRGGKEMAATDAAMARVVRSALDEVGLPPDLVTVLDDPDRSQLRTVLRRPDQVDVVIPRGSPSLVEYCRTTSSIPVIASGGGVNHLYVHRSADLAMAATLTLDSKLPEPAGCTSVELVLVDQEVAGEYLTALRQAIEDQADVLTVRLDPAVQAPPLGPALPVEPLQQHDYGREFLDPVIGVVAVADVTEAVEHIRRFGSRHTEGVVATDPAAVAEFVRHVDAAALVLNGSLRLHDGPRLGLGAELSIATGRLHVRGPVTLSALVTYTWVVEANGALRG